MNAADLPQQMTLFAQIPLPRVRRGPKPGQRPCNANWDTATKVARVPLAWNMAELRERLEGIQSALSTAEANLDDARARSADGTLSNRFAHLADFVDDLRTYFPRGDAYDLFKD